MRGIKSDHNVDEAAAGRRLPSPEVVLLSGGTSKAGDLSTGCEGTVRAGRCGSRRGAKPGKPICLAAERGKPVVILPGFHLGDLHLPRVRRAGDFKLGGRPALSRPSLTARSCREGHPEVGRTEYLLVGLVETGAEPAAYPMGRAGSVTAFSRADGFVTIGRHEEMVEAGTPVTVTLFGVGRRPADLVVIGSHCTGLDYLLGLLQDQGLHTKFLAVGSTAGLEAARRGECDLAGMHLLDPRTGQYNRPLLPEGVELIEGYGRRQGIVFRPRSAFRGPWPPWRSIPPRRFRLPDGRATRERHANPHRSSARRFSRRAIPASFSHNAVAAAVMRAAGPTGAWRSAGWPSTTISASRRSAGDTTLHAPRAAWAAGGQGIPAIAARDDVRERLQMGFVL